MTKQPKPKPVKAWAVVHRRYRIIDARFIYVSLEAVTIFDEKNAAFFGEDRIAIPVEIRPATPKRKAKK